VPLCPSPVAVPLYLCIPTPPMVDPWPGQAILAGRARRGHRYTILTNNFIRVYFPARRFPRPFPISTPTPLLSRDPLCAPPLSVRVSSLPASPGSCLPAPSHRTLARFRGCQHVPFSSCSQSEISPVGCFQGPDPYYTTPCGPAFGVPPLSSHPHSLPSHITRASPPHPITFVCSSTPFYSILSNHLPLLLFWPAAGSRRRHRSRPTHAVPWPTALRRPPHRRRRPFLDCRR